MASTVTAVARAPTRRRSAPRWLAIPSWMISLTLHAALLLSLAVMFHRPQRVGDPNSSNMEVGIIFDPNGSGEFDLPGSGRGNGPPGEKGDSAPGEGDDETSPAAETASSTGAAPAELKLDDHPPVSLDLPTRSIESISAPSGPTGGSPFGNAPQMIRSTGTSTGSGGSGGRGEGGSGGGMGRGGGGGGGGGTSFFGHKVRGRKFLYLVDISGSMHDYNAISRAKAELLASLEQLDANQQFQIIFYSEKCHPMDLTERGERKPQFYAGTDANRRLASQFIRSIQPYGGTLHFKALMEALSSSPEVIFFLTDAGEPMLNARELETIRLRNNHHTQIHTIELGKLADLSLDNNFLKKLARENDGAHVYRDIRKFEQE